MEGLWFWIMLTALPQTSMSFCVPVAPGSTGDAREREWGDFIRNHGRWRGQWTTYDECGIQQGQADRLDTNLQLSPDGTRMAHVNTLFVGSVDSECSTCFDSVETHDIPVGVYSKDVFRQRACESAYLHGPGVTPRGDMSTEIGFRDGDSRVRFILVHRPPVEQLTGVEPPAQLDLERVVIVKESRNIPPSEEETSPSADLLWPQLDPPNWLGLWHGSTNILESVNGGSVDDAVWRTESFSPTHLRKCRCSGNTDEASDSYLSLELDGSIRLEAPKVINAGQPSELAIGWAVGVRKKSNQRRILQANVRIEAFSRIVDTVDLAEDVPRITVSPPMLLRFAVDDLKPVESAGLG